MPVNKDRPCGCTRSHVINLLGCGVLGKEEAGQGGAAVSTVTRGTFLTDPPCINVTITLKTSR